MDQINHQTDPRFHQRGRIVAVLEPGTRAHGEIWWVHLYYPLGSLYPTLACASRYKSLQSVLQALQ